MSHRSQGNNSDSITQLFSPQMRQVCTPVQWQLARIIRSLPASARIRHHKRTSPHTTTMTHAVSNSQHVLINGFHPQISNTTNKMLPKVSMVYGNPHLGSRLCSNCCFAHTPRTNCCRRHRLSQHAPGRCHRHMNTMNQLHTRTPTNAFWTCQMQTLYFLTNELTISMGSLLIRGLTVQEILLHST